MHQPELRYLAIGKVVRAHGLRGELSVSVLTEFPERFETTAWVYLGGPYEAVPYRVAGYRWHQQNVLLTLDGITDRTQAEQFKSQYVQVPIEEAVPLPEGEVYLYQLIGLQVFTAAGELLGAITDVLETGANDVYVVSNGDREILLPAIPSVVLAVDVPAGRITVELIDGLI
jgi:16S rRNA processing protein RimM